MTRPRGSAYRCTGAKRGFAIVKDPAASDIARGWCRLMGLAPFMLFIAPLLIFRSQRILAAWNADSRKSRVYPAIMLGLEALAFLKQWYSRS